MGAIKNLFKDQRFHHCIKKLLPWALYFILSIALFRLYFHLPDSSINEPPQITISSSPSSSFRKEEVNTHKTSCDYTDGKWVPDKLGPLYNESTCSTIKEGQNCISHGRSDLGFLYWRWQPKNCNLPRFNPDKFLQNLRNKHIAFVGDSMARNQLESLLCMLSSSSPNLVYRDGKENKFRKWHFPSHNATVSVYWSPFLIAGVEKSSDVNHNKLFLNRVNEKWAADLGSFHVVVLSIGHWFLHPAVYFNGDSVLGCHYCPGLNYTEVGFYDSLRKALRTTFQTIIERRGFSSSKIEVFLTTFSPSHFEGEWDKAGACPKTKPYEENEKKLEGMEAEIRSIEMETVEEAKLKARKMVGLRIEALDVTKMSLMRADGHPGPYMNPFPNVNGASVQNDCVHWCLPGPVDTWNQILLQMMMNKWEQRREDIQRKKE